MGRIEHVIFDMDEVLVDLVGPVEKLVGKKAVWEPGKYFLHEALGILPYQLWAHHCGKHQFWVNLPPHPWVEQIIHYVEDKGCTWSIATQPTEESHYSASGKAEWIRRNFGPGFTRYSITPEKWRMSKKGVCLVDDCDTNCNEFVTEGDGDAILFAQPWNSKHDRVSKPGRVIDFIESFERLDKERPLL